MGSKGLNFKNSELEKAISERENLHAERVFCAVDKCSKIQEERHVQNLGYGLSQYALVRASCIKQCLDAQLGEDFSDQRIVPEVEGFVQTNFMILAHLDCSLLFVVKARFHIDFI